MAIPLLRQYQSYGTGRDWRWDVAMPHCAAQSIAYRGARRCSFVFARHEAIQLLNLSSTGRLVLGARRFQLKDCRVVALLAKTQELCLSVSSALGARRLVLGAALSYLFAARFFFN